jgi:hypothetical protein
MRNMHPVFFLFKLQNTVSTLSPAQRYSCSDGEKDQNLPEQVLC